MDNNPLETEVDNFKIDFKYYKQKVIAPSLKNVLDFDNDASVRGKVSSLPIEVPTEMEGMQPSKSWEIFRINEVTGLYFIKNAFSEENQIYWAQKCAEEYIKSPHVTNLDVFQTKESVDSAWNDSQAQHSSQFGKKDANFLKDTPIWKLRWSTLGYHHDWSTKIYQKDFKSAFPTDLKDVCMNIAKTLGFTEFCPEAAIVNFYHVGSTLAPHKDISEADLSLPLISISLGLDAIFLIGGDTKDIKPTALFLRSGDVIVMSGACRTAYHALPRVMESTRLDSEADDFLSMYLRNSRINLNVRQVESSRMSLP